MTEAEWLACDDPKQLLEAANSAGPLSARKRLLIACAVCRASWGNLAEDRARLAVEGLEHIADGSSASLPPREMTTATVEVRSPMVGWIHLRPLPIGLPYVVVGSPVEPGTLLCQIEALAVFNSIEADCSGVIVEVCADDQQVIEYNTPLFRLVPTPQAELMADDAARRAARVRDIIPYPPRKRPSFSSAAADVLSIAQATYTRGVRPTGELENLRLSVLADALDEAGCADTAILGHLRSAGPHVRGCWALDLILGKE